MQRVRSWSLVRTAATAVACSTAAAISLTLAVPAVYAQSAPTAASARLMDANGKLVGTATLTQQANGVQIAAQVQGLTAGSHGIHIHAVGSCVGPDFASASGHFNPTNAQHGLQNPQGAHAGDLPNLMVNAGGAGSMTYTDTRVTLGSGANSLFGPQGTALVIHANADDEMTDPSGNSGGRIACGTIVRGAAALPATGSGDEMTLSKGSLSSIAGGGLAGIVVGGITALILQRRRRTPLTRRR